METSNNEIKRRTFSRAELAEMTGQSQGKIDLDIRRGLLRVRKIGRRVLIPRESVDEYLGGGRV